MFKLVQPPLGELNSQIQLNLIGLNNEAREPALGEWFRPIAADPHHKRFIMPLSAISMRWF